MKLPSFALALLLLVPCSLHAQQMSYQGRLTDDSGAAKPGPNATITFSLWDHPTAGNKVWGDFQRNVDLIDGRFSVKLGDSTGNDGNGNILKDEFGGPRYLQLTVGNDSPLPRQEVLYSPKAFHALESDHALEADEATHATTAGHATTATAIGNPGGGTPPLTVDFPNGRVGVGTTTPQRTLHVKGSAPALALEGTDHTFIEFYPKTFAEGRKAYLGFGSGLDDGFTLQSHEDISVSAGKDIYLNASTGNINLSADLHVFRPDTDTATISATGSSQGGGMVYVGQSTAFGGGIAYDGNGIPDIVGETDRVTFFRRSNDEDIAVFQYPQNSNDVTFNGKVGIGTEDPTRAKLHVEGDGGGTGAPITDWGRYTNYAPASGPNISTGYFTNPGNTNPLSIFASGNVAANVYYAFSDERIKRVQGPSDPSADLSTLLGIEITDYSYIDSVAKGNTTQKKVIAQQVEEIFPQAVSRMTDVVPDIYQKATVTNGWVQLPTDLKKGDRVRLIGPKNKGVHEILEVAEGKFRTAFIPEGDEVFVYGREVDDFRTVDYEAIAMLNVSATQELHRQLKSAQTELAAKTNEISTLEQRLADLEAANKDRDEKFAKIERLLDLSPKIVPVSID